MTDAFEDPDNEGNSWRYYTGKDCINDGCDLPAGTRWSPHWCFKCNVERMKRISKNMKDIVERMGNKS